MRIARSLSVFITTASLIEAGCWGMTSPNVQSNEVDRSHASEFLAIPLEAVAPPKPRRLTAGETCRGILSISVPAAGSGEAPDRRCYPLGELDKSYTPGIVEFDLTSLFSEPSSVVRFDSKTLESIGATDITDLGEYVPDTESENSNDPPNEAPDSE